MDLAMVLWYLMLVLYGCYGMFMAIAVLCHGCIVYERYVGKGTITQEPTSITKVEPQEPVLHLDNTRIKEHSKYDIIKNTTTMLKSFAALMIATTLQLKVPSNLQLSTTRYATSFINTLP